MAASVDIMAASVAVHTEVVAASVAVHTEVVQADIACEDIDNLVETIMNLQERVEQIRQSLIRSRGEKAELMKETHTIKMRDAVSRRALERARRENATLQEENRGLKSEIDELKELRRSDHVWHCR